MLRAPLAAPGAELRRLMAEGTVVAPGVYDGLSAVSATKAGASALYLSGGALTNALLGVPDIALATLTEFAAAAARITAVAGVPVLSDADTGFGGATNTFRTVIEMERAGLAGIHLEDQLSPKRCGHLDGKSLIEASEMEAKLRAGVEARRDSSFVLCARTDARGVSGMADAIDRARRYIAAGADMIFPEGLAGEEEFAEFRAAVPDVPLLANMTEFGKTPLIPASRFAELGYALVIFPVTMMRAALRTLDDGYAELLATGTQAGLMDRLRTRKELYARIDYAAYDAHEARWAGPIDG